MNAAVTYEISIIDEDELVTDEDKVNQTVGIENVQILSLFKISVVMIFMPLIVSSNCLVLVALYRFKRLRTASSYFLASLASSDLGTGLCLPVTFYVQLSEKKQIQLTAECYIPFCMTITLSSVSILMMAAIAVDRFTSLAQPLQYNNMITRTWVHRYIVAFWIYAFVVGFVPLIHKMSANNKKNNVLLCDFTYLLDQSMQLFLFFAVLGPSAVIILGCYGYIYVVARYHAKAIYTVEISLRQHQECAHHRYSQTLAITVGIFVLLWLPFQIGAVYDVIHGTIFVRKWIHFYFTLPVILNSTLNPWIYAYKNTEMKTAVVRIIQDILKCVGYKSVRYSCPMNVIVASANADRITTTEFNNHVSSQLNLTNMTPMRYTTVLMSSLHESDLTSTTNNTIICRIETAACLAARDCKHIFDINRRTQVTSI